MNTKNDLLQKMKAGIGTEDPILFFDKMVDVLSLLFNQIDVLESKLNKTRIAAALAIQWEPKVARTMITDQISLLRDNKEDYIEELSQLKKAFLEDKVTQNYNDFCTFWEETLGFHPFLDYK